MKGIISVIIPLFNRGTLILETLNSIVEQTYQNYECLIIDDGSTDNSFEVVENYIQQRHQFRLFKRASKTKGACACRNEGIARASGAYTMFLDSDDLLDVHCFENRISAFSANSECDFIVTQAGIFDQTTYQVKSYWSSLLHKSDLEAFLFSEGWCISNTTFKTNFIKNYSFDEMALSWQDVDFHLRILLDEPRYFKFPTSAPDVYIRRSGFIRVSNTNVSFDRIESRLNLLIKLERLMESKNCSLYKFPFLIYHFKFLEIAALVLPYAEFRKLFDIWKTSNTFNYQKAKFYRLYLLKQAYLKKIGLRLVCSALYRMIRLYVPSQLLYARNREIRLPEPLNLYHLDRRKSIS